MGDGESPASFARSRSVFVLVVAVLTGASSAGAASERGWDASLELGTDFPVSVGVRGRVELASHYRIALGVGFMPGAYVDAINGFVVGMGWYDESTATLIKNSLKSSLVVAPSLGVRPWSAHGLYFEGGYRLVMLGGEATAGELIGGLTGQAIPDSRVAGERSFSAHSTLHLVSVEIGWEWLLEKRWQLRTALGGVFTVASATTIEPDYEARAERVMERFTALGANALNELETSYIHAPFVSVSVGYSF